MAPFTVSHDSPLPPAEAWARVTDWPRHGRFVPLTTVTVDHVPSRVGTVFTARTAVGRVGFDDPMEVVSWQPPEADGAGGHCRLEKRGRVMLGWAELTVEPHGTGSRTTWREEARAAKAPRFADGVSATAGRLLFGRVLRKLLDDPA
jgi:hypothetical protein